MKNLNVRVDEKFFYKLSNDKSKKEKELKKDLSWEQYIKILFGMQ